MLRCQAKAKLLLTYRWSINRIVCKIVFAAVPFFPMPLQDQHVDVGSSFTLRCQAKAVPAPTYQWYKDGEPLTLDTDMELSINMVTFHNADPEKHNGMYECTATNIYGSAVTTAQVRVLSELQFMIL